MQSSKPIDDDADRFLREGLREYIPAVQALNSFIHLTEGRIRKVLEPYDMELRQLSIASSTSKISFSPNIGEEQADQTIEVGVRDPDRSGFYIQIDFKEEPSRSLCVGFWLYTPVSSQERQELFQLLSPVCGSDGYEVEQANYKTA